MKLKDIELINPLHIKMVSNGCGEFPDGYKLTEKGILLIQEFSKQCFIAGIEAMGNSIDTDPKEIQHFEDYLKSLEDGQK